VITLVAICGSLRSESSNRALLEAAASLAPADVAFVPYLELGELPHFNPDLDAEGAEPPPAVRRLRKLLIDADGIVISTPEYAHGLPGSFKNMLDWLVSTGELVGKPVAVLNASPAGGHHAQAALVEILRTMNWRVVDDASLLDPFLPRKLGGAALDEASAARVLHALDALVASVGGHQR
jgi:chromate reductase